MKTKYFFLAAAAALFAACSSDDGIAEQQQQAKQQAEQVPVAFDAYVNRGTTRAGYSDKTIDSSTDLQAVTEGFGIFAYYTNSDTYDPIFTPNFMYNQQVQYASKWDYSPVKYWPNEFLSANAEENDKVSFFAYAPYVACTPSTGKLTEADADKKDYGIVGFTRNTAASDPLVKYIASFDLAKQVDLLWGVCPQTSWDIKNSKQQTMTVGKPWLNVEHPRLVNASATVKFLFKHALANLAVNVDLYADATTATDVTETDNTKIYIRSVTFSGFATKGSLNLNNVETNKPLWLSADGTTDIESGVETTIYDGRKDGKEGLFAASNEKQLINTTLIQDDKAWDTANDGVTKTATNLFNASATTSQTSIYVIPNNDPLTVTIVYDVLTADDSLPGYLNNGTTHGSVVTNTITKPIKTAAGTAITLEALKKYTINLHIGLHSVVVDADVTGWGEAIEGGADLPTNNNN